MMHLEFTLLMLPMQREKGDPFDMRDHIIRRQVGLSSMQDFLKSRTTIFENVALQTSHVVLLSLIKAHKPHTEFARPWD